MSQREVLKILEKLNGSCTIDELAYYYNLEHFGPTNTDYSKISIVVVKKTMAHDIAKLLRDRIITKTRQRRPHDKPLIKYHLTEYGSNRLHLIQPLYNLQTTTL